MSFQASNVPTRIAPVGTYNPARRYPAAPQQPTVPTNPTPVPGYHPPTGGQPGGIYVPVPSMPQVPSGVKNFFGDVWTGSVDQLKSNGKRVLNPIGSGKAAISYLDKSPRQMFHAFVDPYVNEIKAGHTGRAVGKLLGNVVTIGGIVLGARFLINGGLGGGASVGSSGPIGNFFSGVGNVIGKVTRPIGNLVGGAFHAVGNVVRWLIPGGGGPSVGFR